MVLSTDVTLLHLQPTHPHLSMMVLCYMSVMTFRVWEGMAGSTWTFGFFNKGSHFVVNHFFQEEQISDLELLKQFRRVKLSYARFCEPDKHFSFSSKLNFVLLCNTDSEKQKQKGKEKPS